MSVPTVFRRLLRRGEVRPPVSSWPDALSLIFAICVTIAALGVLVDGFGAIAEVLEWIEIPGFRLLPLILIFGLSILQFSIAWLMRFADGRHVSGWWNLAIGVLTVHVGHGAAISVAITVIPGFQG